MIREAEALVGHRVGRFPLVSEPVNLGKGMRNCGVFVVGRFVIPPVDRCIMLPPWVDCLLNCTKSVRKWKIARIEVEWKNPSVTLVNAYKGAWNWIHDRKVRVGEEKTQSRHLPKLLHPLYNRWIPFVDLNAVDEDIEAF